MHPRSHDAACFAAEGISRDDIIASDLGAAFLSDRERATWAVWDSKRRAHFPQGGPDHAGRSWRERCVDSFSAVRLYCGGQGRVEDYPSRNAGVCAHLHSARPCLPPSQVTQDES